MRCKICNKVSHTEIADDYDYVSHSYMNLKGGSFHSHDLDVYCEECEQSYRDVMTEFDMEDQADDEFDEEFEDEEA